MKRMLIILISLVLVSNAYAADKKAQSSGSTNAPAIPSAAPDPDDVSKKAQQEATQKSNYMNSKYKQHSKKDNPNQTAAQTQAKHGGPTASNVAVPSQTGTNSAPSKKSNTKKK